MHGAHLTREELNQKTGEIVDAAIKIHTVLGPGLLESAYQACMAYELARRGLHIVEQYPVPIAFEELRIPIAYRTDLVVDDAVVVELKAVERLAETHEAQLQTHLRLGEFRVGLLFNFNEPHLRNGIRRRVNSF